MDGDVESTIENDLWTTMYYYHESHSIKTRSLFMDNENKLIVYPRLKKFHFIYGCEPDDTKKLRVDQAIAPFPVLKHLIWEGFYVFEDDTIFRGNSNTLEYLNIGIDASLFEILKKHRVFGPGKYLNLQHVSLWKLHYNEGVAFAHGEFERFAVSIIGPVTKYFGITAENLSYLTDFMRKSPYRESIQALDLISFMGTLDELFGIVGLLPNLTKLFSSPGTIECEPSTVEFRKFVDSYYKKGCFARHRLQRWDVGLQYLDDIKFIAPTALALAALCPSFALVCSQYNIDEYKNKVKEAVACGRLNDYIEGTKHLL
ncbi:hypothetical protein GGI11_001328 [Coemansia sp. RSA 2049]|nr:hypothetical protein GGI11_001328 [Coemansia sp. RSA 2049]